MAWVAGIECDVSSPASVQRLMSAAASQMGSVDVWINNAGNSGSFQVLPTSLLWKGICRLRAFSVRADLRPTRCV